MKVFHRFCENCGKPQKPSEMLICASFCSVCGNLTNGSGSAKTTTTQKFSTDILNNSEVFHRFTKVFHRVVEN